MRIFVSLMIVLMAVWTLFVGISAAQEGSLERQKAKIVSRVYQLTYGAEEMCKRYSPQESNQVSEAVAKFKNTYPELMKLVKESPYLDKAKKRMSILIDRMEKNPEDTECLAAYNMLQQCTDTESGKQDILKTIAELKK
jgi:hypothetical protein